MAYTLQMLRALIATHPDRAMKLAVHVNALEATIEHEPERSLERVRALFEATCYTIAPHLDLEIAPGEDFKSQNSRIIKAMNFSLDGHQDGDKIGEVIKKLIGSINGAVGALAELSNIPGMRHGAPLDWSTLQRQHAVMLGGLCDTLISFLFEVAWTRAAANDGEIPSSNYIDFSEFNEELDEEYGNVDVAGSPYLTSRALFALDPLRYDELRIEWAVSDPEVDTDEAAA